MHGREKIDSNVYSRQASLILLKDSTNSSDGTKCFDEIVFAGEGGLLFGRPKKLQFRTLRRRQGSGPIFYSFQALWTLAAVVRDFSARCCSWQRAAAVM
jgi:hypothetical protein